MLTSRPASEVRPGDRLPYVQNTAGEHSGQVLTEPERTASTYGEVLFRLRCDRHGEAEEQVRLPAHDLIAVDRIIA